MGREIADFDFKSCESGACAFCSKEGVETGISINSQRVVPICSSCLRAFDETYFLLAAEKIIRYRINLECSLDVAIRDLFPEAMAELLLSSNKDLLTKYCNADEPED